MIECQFLIVTFQCQHQLISIVDIRLLLVNMKSRASRQHLKFETEAKIISETRTT